MPYTSEHKQRSREKILESAVTLFCHRGFDKVSIDDLMQHAQLTRGGFYAHFKSKGDVYQQAIIAAAKNSRIIRDIPEGLEKSDFLEWLINSYLSLYHVNQESSPCPMAFLVTDVANNQPEVRQTYTTVYEGFAAVVARNLPDEYGAKKRKRISFSLTAMMIGTVAIARALDDESLQKTLLANSRETALRLINDEVVAEVDAQATLYA